MKILFYCLMCFLGFTINSFAAPTINNVTSSTPDGQEITISGSGFTSNPLDIEWLGNNIENGKNGEKFSKLKWELNGDSSAWYDPRYDSSESHSGTNSILSKWSQNYGSTFIYNNGEEIKNIYATWWVKFDYNDSAGQWKMWRLRTDGHVNDISPEIYATSWYSGSANKMMHNRPNVYSDSEWLSSGVKYLQDDDAPSKGKWVRIEFYAEGSTQGVSNGTFKYYIHNQSTPVNAVVNLDGNLMTYGPSQTNRWQYIVLGQYWGNTSGPSEAFARYDDVFFQLGTQARVELGDKSSWENCTFREIQVPTKWTDNSITISFNQGSYKEGETAYLYVVDANGNVNKTGVPITVGASVGETDPVPSINFITITRKAD